MASELTESIKAALANVELNDDIFTELERRDQIWSAVVEKLVEQRNAYITQFDSESSPLVTSLIFTDNSDILDLLEGMKP